MNEIEDKELKTIQMPTEVVHIKNSEDFNNLVQKYQDKIIVIDFWAEWCGPCKRFAPVFKQSQKEWGENFIFIKLNTDDVPEIAQTFGIQAIPTMAFVKNKKLINRQIGAMRKEQFYTILKEIKESVEKSE